MFYSSVVNFFMINRIFAMTENIFLLKHTIERLSQLTSYDNTIIYHKKKKPGKVYFFPRQTSFLSDKFKRKVKIELNNTLEKYWEIKDADNGLRNYLFEITLPIVVVRVIATVKNIRFATVYGTRDRKKSTHGKLYLSSKFFVQFLKNSDINDIEFC